MSDISAELAALLKTHNLRADVKKSPVVIPVGYAQCAVHIRRGTDQQLMAVTFGVSWSAPNHDTIAQDVGLAWVAAIPNTALGNQITTVEVVARVAEEGGDPTVQTAAIGVTGTQSGFLYTSQNVSMLVKKLTNKGGRPNAGRMFVPLLLESDVDMDGKIASSAMTQYQGWWTNFLNFLSGTLHGNSTPMVILHALRKSGVLPSPTTVTALLVDALVATQRRRLRP